MLIGEFALKLRQTMLCRLQWIGSIVGGGKRAGNALQPFADLHLIVEVQAQARIEALQRHHVDRNLFGKLPGSLLLESIEPGLLHIDRLPCALHLRLEEFRHLRRLTLAGLRVLVHIESGQRVGNRCRALRVETDVRDLQSDGGRPSAIGPRKIDANVAPHPLHQRLH